MAKNTSITPLAVLTRLKKEAAKATTALKQDIAQREAELAALRAELERWQTVLAEGKRVKEVTGEQRLDWDGVLAALPATFTPQDVMRQTGKPMAQVYSGLSRWTKEKKVRRVERGGYRRMSAGSRPVQRATKETAPTLQEKATKG